MFQSYLQWGTPRVAALDRRRQEHAACDTSRNWAACGRRPREPDRGAQGTSTGRWCASAPSAPRCRATSAPTARASTPRWRAGGRCRGRRRAGCPPAGMPRQVRACSVPPRHALLMTPAGLYVRMRRTPSPHSTERGTGAGASGARLLLLSMPGPVRSARPRLLGHRQAGSMAGAWAAGTREFLACSPVRAAASAAAGRAGAPGAGAGALRQQLRQDGSRHRYRHAPPDTPPGFWKVGFPGDSLVRSASPPWAVRAAPSRAPPRHAALHETVGCLSAALVRSSHRGCVTAAARRTNMLPGVMYTALRAPGFARCFLGGLWTQHISQSSHLYPPSLPSQQQPVRHPP